ncbi:MAG: HEAT repeat domain-containing protein [Planctomycetota bacterium]
MATSPYSRQLDELLPAMGAAEIPTRAQASTEWEKLCFEVGAPGRQAERRAVCAAMCARLGPQTARPARIWLLRQLERIGEDESVGPVAALLDERDGEIRDLARRVLQNIPGERSGQILRAALADATEPEWKVALLNTLGARRDSTVIPLYIRLADDQDPRVVRAAIAALGDTNKFETLDALGRLWDQHKELRPLIGDAMLRSAWRIQGRGAQKIAAYERLLATPDAPVQVTIGALSSLARFQGPAVLDRLLPILADPNAQPALRGAAANLAARLPGPRVAPGLLDVLGRCDTRGQVLVLGALAERADALARPAVTELLAAQDADVRLAAIQALAKLGDVSSWRPLAEIAAASDGTERDAVRRSVARLTAKGVDEALLAALPEAAPPIRGEMIRALAARRHQAAVPALLREARSPAADVAVAAFNALGELAAVADTPDLLAAAIAVRDEQACTAAEDAVAAVCNRVAEPEERARPVLAVYREAPPETRVSLMRVLGRVGGAAALEEIRKASASDDAALRDAAIRCLAKWPTAEVLDDLLALAKEAENKTHRVLALQGYVRLLGVPGDRQADTTAALYAGALELADRPEERKAVLGGLAGCYCRAALAMAEKYLDDEGLKAEAQSAAISIAAAIGPSYPDECRAVIQKVVAAEPSADLRKRANAALETIRKSAGYMVHWQVSGPYFKDELKGEKIVDEPFAPEAAVGAQPEAGAPTEGPGGTEITWEPLPTTNANEPWVFNLGSRYKGGERCVYARTAIYSAAPRRVRLEIGSDDAVKAWLNGTGVHEFRGPRSHTAFQDKVAVDLRAGWNTLLLKVIQYGGDWVFSAGLTADGAPLEGVRFAAEPPGASESTRLPE